MLSMCAFHTSLPYSSRGRFFKSRIFPRSPDYTCANRPLTCTVQPPPGSAGEQDLSKSTDDAQPTGNRIAKIFASLGRTRKETLATYGIAAIIAYGLFDAITYTASFVLSLRAYIAAGKTLSWRTLPQVLALMWGINNLSRPFRVAGALALAPLVDRRIVQPVRSFLARRTSDS